MSEYFEELDVGEQYVVTTNAEYYPAVTYFKTLPEAESYRDKILRNELEGEWNMYEYTASVSKVLASTLVREFRI